MRIKYRDGEKEKFAEMILANGASFLIRENSVSKITNKIENSSIEELSKSVEEQKAKKSVEINSKTFEILRKELGEFEISL